MFLLQGCDPLTRRGNELRYELSIDYVQDSRRKVQAAVFSVHPKQFYNTEISTWRKDWGGISCTLKGSSLAIPVKNGTIVMPIGNRANYTGHWPQCVLVKRVFDIRSSDWVNPWNALARSSTYAALPKDKWPSLIFIPSGGSVADSVKIDNDRKYGVKIERVSMRISQQKVTPVLPTIAAIIARSETDPRSCLFKGTLPKNFSNRVYPCPTLIGGNR
jgi:hypothetical protein